MIVSPEMDAVTPDSTWNTRLSPPPLTVTPAAGPVIVSVPLVLLSASWPPVSVIVCARGEDSRVEGDRVGAGLDIGQVDRPAQVERPERAADAVDGRVDHERDRLDLEGADVHGAADNAGEAALIGRDATRNEGDATRRRWPGCRARAAMVSVGPP